MKSTYYTIPVLCILIGILACKDTQKPRIKKQSIITNQKSWKNRFDFDNDNRVDTLFYKYTGGAHCCYQISIYLSTKDTIIHFPFHIEGGYMLFDLSKPNNFYIYDIDKDTRPEIFINTAVTDSANYSKKSIYIDFETSSQNTNQPNYYSSIKYKTFDPVKN